MAKKTYAAAFEPAAEGGFGISFPDLPGCVSFGEDLDACMRQAHEALTLHLEGMAEDGEAFPDPAPLRDLIADMNNKPGLVWASIEVEAPDAAERVNVYLPKSLLDRVDRYVSEHSPMNRSTFFTEAARLKLGRGTGLGGAGLATRMLEAGGLAGADRVLEEEQRSIALALNVARAVLEADARANSDSTGKSAGDLVGRKAR
jgi:predicted RNase H-like HicB family nuclease